MGRNVPKQFISINDKPIIAYTLEAFEKHPLIDKIFVVCLKGWEPILECYAKDYKISKLCGICESGPNGQDSIRNGLNLIKEKMPDDDGVIVLIHDAIRPLVSKDIITNNINTCRQMGNCVTVVPCMSAMLMTKDGIASEEQVPRDSLKITQTPQTFFLDEILEVHKEALDKGICNSVASCTLYVEMGRKLFLTYGSESNIKLTTHEDIELFAALLKIVEL